uniref:SH2 domain-containing protein n=1 Tax=Haemonchus placei TaxID=6290 RepID=A0A0N4W9B0_HAEPC
LLRTLRMEEGTWSYRNECRPGRLRIERSGTKILSLCLYYSNIPSHHYRVHHAILSSAHPERMTQSAIENINSTEISTEIEWSANHAFLEKSLQL